MKWLDAVVKNVNAFIRLFLRISNSAENCLSGMKVTSRIGISLYNAVGALW